MKNSYTIKELIGLFLNKIWIIIIVTITGGILSFGFSKMFLPFEYSSHVSMYVQSYTGISDRMADQNNISNSKQLVNTYMEVLKDDAVMAAIGELLLEQCITLVFFVLKDTGDRSFAPFCFAAR